MNKQGQVTIFVVLGLVLVLITALFLVLRNTSTEVDTPTQEITHDFSQVKASYEQAAARCLKSEGKLVIKQLMIQGGYLNPREEGIIPNEFYPTKGRGVLLGDNAVIPYWIEHNGVLGCFNDCSFTFSAPPLTPLSAYEKSIEERASYEITNTVQTCLDKIYFSDDYEVSASPKLHVDVLIGEQRVDYHLLREVNFTYLPTDATMTVQEVDATSVAYVKNLYDEAITLLEQMELSNTTSSIGDVIKNIILIYSMTEEGELPPMYGGKKLLSGDDRRWIYPEVKESLKMNLADNLPFIKLKGTAQQTLFLENNMFSQNLYNTNVFTPAVLFNNAAFASQMSVDFLYDPRWEIELRISPSNGYIIEPYGDDDIPLLSELSFALMSYEFSYDVKVPIIIVLQEKMSFDGEGLTLMFAVESGLSYNEPLGTEHFELPQQDITLDLFGDSVQQESGRITVQAYDEISNSPLEDVEIQYLCGDSMIETAITNEEGEANFYLPHCLGGFIRGDLDNYKSDSIPLSVIDNEEVELEIPMAPYKEFDVAIRAYELYRAQVPGDDASEEEIEEYANRTRDMEGFGLNSDIGLWEVGTEQGFIQADDQLILVMTRNTGMGEETEVINKVINVTSAAGQTVKLAKGTYDVEGYLIRRYGEGHLNNDFTVPEDEVCWNEGWFDGEEECETIDAVVFNESLLVGGLSLIDMYDLALEVRPEHYANDTLEIKYMEINLDDVTDHNSLAILGELEGYSRMYNESLQPIFKE